MGLLLILVRLHQQVITVKAKTDRKNNSKLPMTIDFILTEFYAVTEKPLDTLSKQNLLVSTLISCFIQLLGALRPQECPQDKIIPMSF